LAASIAKDATRWKQIVQDYFEGCKTTEPEEVSNNLCRKTLLKNQLLLPLLVRTSSFSSFPHCWSKSKPSTFLAALQGKRETLPCQSKEKPVDHYADEGGAVSKRKKTSWETREA
jgi:hypothetical protein